MLGRLVLGVWLLVDVLVGVDFVVVVVVIELVGSVCSNCMLFGVMLSMS